jgi:putative ABC transport system permease protein
VLLPRPLFDDLVARAEQEAGIPPGSLASTGLGAFTAIDLAEEVDAETFVASLGPERLTWHRAGFEPFTYTDPVRPAAIADAASLRGVPVALGAFFALAMALGLFVGIAVATRSRARELAVLRALGAPGRDLAGTVRWHALAVIGVALLVGAPLGVLAGRLLFRAFASDVGVVPRVIVSAPRIAAVAAVAIVVGLVAAAGPGRRWARHAPAQVLRDE